MAKLATNIAPANQRALDNAANLVIREDNAEQIAKAIDQALAAALEEMGLAAERFAKDETPVDTGRLKNSITHALDLGEDAVYVGTNVEYGPPVESRAHMLEHAASKHSDRYREIAERHLKSG